MIVIKLRNQEKQEEKKLRSQLSHGEALLRGLSKALRRRPTIYETEYQSEKLPE